MKPIVLSSLSLCLPLLSVLGACRSHTHVERVDSALLRHVDEDGRRSVADARRARDEAEDAVIAARADLQRAKAELQVAREERDVAVARFRAADTTLGMHDPGVADASASRDANERVAVALADDRIIWRKCEIEAEERRIELLEAKQRLADAKVEQAKATALLRADRPEVDALTLDDIERAVRRCETDVKVAEIRLQAAEKEVGVAKGRAEESDEKRRERIRTRFPHEAPATTTDSSKTLPDGSTP